MLTEAALATDPKPTPAIRGKWITESYLHGLMEPECIWHFK
jgi:hypothetical protein